MGRDILFQVTKGNLILLFSQRVNSIRGHELSLLGYILEETRLFRFETVLMFTK